MTNGCHEKETGGAISTPPVEAKPVNKRNGLDRKDGGRTDASPGPSTSARPGTVVSERKKEP